MRLGMHFHGWTIPTAPKQDFIRSIKTDTIPIDLYFYLPKDYHATARTDPEYRYPVVVSFHGGGFTLGDATDDRYYARSIQEHTRAVFVSVNYRRAPEHPFPGPVDDGVEALMYIATHGTELRIDPGKTAIAGFSAGGNLCFTVPFRLTYFTNPKRPRLFPGPHSFYKTPDVSRTVTREDVYATPKPEDEEEDLNPRAASKTSITLGKVDVSKLDESLEQDSDDATEDTLLDASSSKLPSQIQADAEARKVKGEQANNASSSQLLEPNSSIYPKRPRPFNISRTSTQYSTLNPDRPTNLKILSIVAFYPLLDWTSSRSAKVRSSIKPELTLKKSFTDLFDYSYLPPPDNAGDHVSPYASPALAPDEMIRDGLPQRMQLFLCEYDMLLSEGKQFVKRLENLGKDVTFECVEGVPHAWDKSPNPFRNQKKIDEIYARAGRNLQSVFDEAERDPSTVRGERIGIGGLR